MICVIFNLSKYQQLTLLPHLLAAMKNLDQAVNEVLGHQISTLQARKFFFNLYEYLLLNDTDTFLDTLDYKMHLLANDNEAIRYNVFKYMMQNMVGKNRKKLIALCPGCPA